MCLRVGTELAPRFSTASLEGVFPFLFFWELTMGVSSTLDQGQAITLPCDLCIWIGFAIGEFVIQTTGATDWK